MLELIFAIIITAAVLALGFADLALMRRRYAELELSEAQLKKVGGKGFGGFLERALDVLFFALLVIIVQVLLSRFASNVCPAPFTYAHGWFVAALSIIPFGLGYVWTILPKGRQGALDAVAYKMGKTEEETPGARLHRILWRPWLGVFYIAYYVIALLAIFVFFRP